MFPSLRGLFRVAAWMGSTATIAGCSAILGLDEFQDQPPSGAGGGGGGCTSPEACPTGEHGTASCDGGTCGFDCEAGFADCDDVVGCETSTTADEQNCGGCGVTCSAYCVAGACNDPVDVAAGDYHACAILKDGSVWCWGNNEFGQLGDGTTTTRTQPTRVDLPGPALQVAAGGMYYLHDGGDPRAHTCALLEDRTLRCWGNNQNGQLGTGDNVSSTTPVSADIENVKQITAGGVHTCAIDTSNYLRCWGSGALGNGSTTGSPSPLPIEASVAHAEAGPTHTCAIKIDGSLLCWGSNSKGQLGSGSQNLQELSPVPVDDVPNAGLIALGWEHTCARSPSGAFCWGDNANGQLGIGTTTGPQALPQAVALSNVDSLSLGRYHSAAVAQGGLYAWGGNQLGQLGDGTTLAALAPATTGLRGVAKIALGEVFSCALTTTNVVLCWGDGSVGQLGNGSLVGQTMPTPVVWP